MFPLGPGGSPCSCARCLVSSASKAVSSTCLVNPDSRPPGVRQRQPLLPSLGHQILGQLIQTRQPGWCRRPPRRSRPDRPLGVDLIRLRHRVSLLAHA
jgi:hypothetical protein